MSTIAPALGTPPTCARPIRLGAVSYLNTLPLIEGLGKLRDVAMTLTAPSRLIDLLMEGSVDLALASVIDAQRAPGPVALVPAGLIGCDGPTLTVRLFSSQPPESIRRVHADIDSHTSIALMRVVLFKMYGTRPEIVEFDADAHRAGGHSDWPPALLLIGDKVVSDSPPAVHYPHQLDLGQAWKDLTSRPFAYAVWMCRKSDADAEVVRTASAVLDRQRRHNATRLDWIIRSRAGARGWNAEIAQHYLRDLLRYEVTPDHRRAIDEFFRLCVEAGVLERVRETPWLTDAALVV